MKNKGFLGLAALGAIALMANAQSSDNAAESAGNLAFSGADVSNVDSNVVEAVIAAIKDSPALRNLMKGEKGAQGIQGLQGLQGIAGEQVKAFGGSLVKNSALELNSLDGWSGSSTATLSAATVFEGMLSLAATFTAFGSITNNNNFYVDNRRLLKVSCRAKSGGSNYRFTIRRLDKDGVSVLHSSDAYIYGLGNPAFNNTAMESKVVYFGGIGSISTNIGLNTAKGLLVCFSDAAGTVELSHLVVQYVSLGEAVPYNLAYLPEGQTVYEPTTGKLGRYNGTAVVWNG